MSDLFEAYRHLFNDLTVNQAIELNLLEEQRDYETERWFLAYLDSKIPVTYMPSEYRVEVRIS